MLAGLMADTKLYENLKIKRENGEAEIEAEIPSHVLEAQVVKVIRNAKKDMELPGFRKGQIPEEIIKKQLDEMHVLEDATDMALREVYPQIVEDEKLDIVTAPRVTITKLAPGNPVSFKARVGIVPEFKLPDYKKIGKTTIDKQEKSEVTEAEVDDTIRNIQMMRMDQEVIKNAKDVKEIQLPELTEEYIKTLGNFTSVEDFKKQIKDGIQEEKETNSRRKTREDIASALIEKTPMTVSSLLVEEEVGALRNRRFEEVQRMGISMEDYLKQVKKTEEELEAEEKSYIERQLKTRFILEQIAKEEKLVADPKIVAENVDYLLERNADADPDRVQNYVESMLVNEQVLALLEGKEVKKVEEKAAEKKPAA